ncbi:hypothetical protein Tco_0361188 [Tanacetum coccineum]
MEHYIMRLPFSSGTELRRVGDFSVIGGHLGNDDLLETSEISCSARIRAMAEEDAFIVDNFEGGVCSDYSDARIVGG